MKRLALGALIVTVASGCRHQPTRLSEVNGRPFGVVIDKSRRPLEITERTVVLDARGAFDFGLNHVRRAVHFTWDRLAERADTGEFIRDLHRAGERLALAGITPDTPVVVVGPGGRGIGEEGRLAWSLLRLGVRDVQVTSNESVRRLWTERTDEPVPNAPAWEPSLNADFEIDRREFRNLATSLDDLRAKRVWLIDVRAPAEFLKGPALPGAVNVDWTEFYAKDGRPNPRVVDRLAGIDVRPGDRVVTICPRGVRAAAAAYALMALGFTRVSVYRDRPIN